MFNQHHQPHEHGRRALRSVLEARTDPRLFQGGQLERLIVASGGNLRDLFEMVAGAADNAAIRGAEKIGEPDATVAISAKRSEYVRRLGASPYDLRLLSYGEKAERLIAVYQQASGCDIPDPTLHSLLRARAVQEFANGERWFGVHPLVVDTLIAHGKLKAKKGAPILGGSC